MNVEFPRFGDQYDGRTMRDFINDLQLAFRKVRGAAAELIIGGGTNITKHLSAKVAWDPANVVNGAQTTTTVTVTGAALNDDVDTVVVGFNKDLQGMRLTGYVSAANTVTVVLRNDTGGAINLASGYVRADVWKH